VPGIAVRFARAVLRYAQGGWTLPSGRTSMLRQKQQVTGRQIARKGLSSRLGEAAVLVAE
jgi:hypothetical protein